MAGDALKLFSKAVSLYRKPQGGLADMFTTPRENIFDGTQVVFDLETVKEELALERERGTGYNRVKATNWDEHTYTPPYYAEEMPLSAQRYNVRSFGQNEFDVMMSKSELLSRDIVINSARLLDKMDRTREKQVCDFFSEGSFTPTVGTALSLGADSGNTAQVSTSWSNVAATAIDDIASLAENVRKTGKTEPNKLVFGDTAWSNFRKNTQVKAELDNRRFEGPGLMTAEKVNGGYLVYHGQMTIKNFVFDLYTHSGVYQNNAGTYSKYISADYVLCIGPGTYENFYAGLDVLIDAPDNLRRIFTNAESLVERQAMQFSVNLVTDKKRKTVSILAESSFIAIPKSINTFGRLKTTAP
jgi:hypothetical protein